MSIAENIRVLTAEIESAALNCGRKTDEIRLIAVSKTVGVEQVREAIACGIEDFGENRVQELMEKYNAIEKMVKWHQIGRLQTNKVKYLIGKNILIHSVDRIELALEISRLSVKAGVDTEILVEVNVSGEESKAGVATKEVDAFLDEIAEMKGIIVSGLMTIAPNIDDLGEIRKVFRILNELYIDITNKRTDNNIQMKFLSMGMSHDFRIAVEEGSNMIRIGTAIFGER